MGTEIIGEAAYRGVSHRIKLHLDGKELTLRDGLKLTIPLKDVRNVAASDGELTVAWAKDKIVLKVGDKAARLADRDPASAVAVRQAGDQGGSRRVDRRPRRQVIPPRS